MGEDNDALTPLKKVIEGLLGDGTLPINPEDGEIWSVWEEVVGTPVARHARPSWIRRGALRVIVSDPIWLQELQFVEKEIRDKLNRRLEREAVKKIEFRTGPG
jgi:predicted nucleic acid-binding Zn ribbon protein